MAYINGKEILFNPQIQLTGSPAEVATEEELYALDTADNVGKIVSYDSGLYIITED